MSGEIDRVDADERFEIRRAIGRGAMGLVVEAFDRERSSTVALKMLHHATPDTIYFFKREFRSLAQIVHPNIVRLYELLHLRDHWLLTMEFIDGTNFMRHVRDEEPPAEEPSPRASLTPGTPSSQDATERLATTFVAPEGLRPAKPPVIDRLLAALSELVDGVDALHRAGVVHRDIKPSNVMVEHGGRVVLLDFGIVAPNRGTDTVDRRIAGTPRYMAPEQLRGDSAPTPASDWYSLGVLLYESLVGRNPFPGSLAMQLDAKERGRPTLPRTLVPTLPESLERVCLALLAPEPARRPGIEDIRDMLGLAPSARARGSGVIIEESTELVGRADHLEQLHRTWNEVREQRVGKVVLVHGASGVGKTTLADAFVRAAQTQGATVLAGRCYAQEHLRFKAVDGLIDDLARLLTHMAPDAAEPLIPPDIHALCQLFPVLRWSSAVSVIPPRLGAPLDPREARRRAFACARELLSRLARSRSVVMFIDDLQWGDLDSAALLAELMRAPAPPLLLVGTYRSEEAGSEMVAALRDGRYALDATTIAVEGLDQAAARRLARELLGTSTTPDDAQAELVANEAAGNPYLLRELVEWMRADASAARRAAATGTLTVDDALRARIATLAAPARRLLELVALAGHPTPMAALGTAGDTREATADLLDELRRRHLVRVRAHAGGHLVEAYHDRVRESLAGALAPEARREGHRRLAEALDAAAKSEPETVALHWDEAGEGARAARGYARAGDAAAEALAFERAATLYTRAIELGAADATAGAELRARLADAFASAGRGLEAAHAYLAAADAASTNPSASALASACRRRAAEELLRAGHIDPGSAELARALQDLGLRPPRRPLAELLYLRARFRTRGRRWKPATPGEADAALPRLELLWSAATVLTMTAHMQGAVFQARHLLGALEAGDPSHVARALGLEAAFRAFSGVGSSAVARRLCDEAEEVARTIDDPEWQAVVLGARAATEYQLAAFDTTRRICEDVLQRLRSQRRVAWFELNTVALHLLWSLAYLGELGELERQVPRLLHETQERGDLYMTVCLSTDLPALAWLVRGDVAGGRAAIADAMKPWSRHGYQVQHWSELLALSSCDLYEGNGEAAFERVEREWRGLRRSLLLGMQVVRCEAWSLRGRAALACAARSSSNLRKTATARAEQSARVLARERIPHATALASQQRAGLAMLAGHTDAARTALEEAIAGFEAQAMAAHLAAARARLGSLVGGDEGAALLQAAAGYYARERVASPDGFNALLAPGF